MKMDNLQEEAIEKCCNKKYRIVAVTGKAGTGKTTIMKRVHEYYNNLQPESVVLCAPTGKAAKRISEATGIPAMTIHRLLEYPKPNEIDEKTGKPLQSGDPKRDRFHPIDYKVVLCDEYSMVHHELHRNLIDALPAGGLIRMFGDNNQLQPVEIHKVYKEKPSPFLEALEKFQSITLTHIYRQAEDSNIIPNADRISMGKAPGRCDDFVIDITDEPVKAIKKIVRENLKYLEGTHQIIVPSRKSWVGTIKLNSLVQSLKDLPLKHVSPERHKYAEDQGINFYEGDKVIMTQNLYELEVFNGESGIITLITHAGEIEVDFGDRRVLFPQAIERFNKYGGTFFYNPQKDLDLAYVVTTHKSQGSEYDEICYILNKSTMFTQNRKNFYTAVTRAKNKVHIVTDQRSLAHSLYKMSDFEMASRRKGMTVSGNIVTMREAQK